MKKLIYSCFLLIIPLLGYSQISTESQPYSWSNKSEIKLKSTSIVTMPHLDMETITKEDKWDDENDIPPRFGFPHTVDLNLQNSGTWQTTSDGGRLWTLEIYSPDALSLNLLYDKFWLPEGGKFYIYTPDQSRAIGAFTALNNKGTKQNPEGFATGLLYGKNIILEYYEPKGVSGGIINIARVVTGYRYIQIPEMTEAYGGSGSCQVNINCSEGNSWQKEKNAVAMILVNGSRMCTGSLVNNTAKDKSPYFLTAHHCLLGGDAVNSPNLSHWSFYWHYENPGCARTGSEPTILSTAGATVVANSSTSDFALLRLTENPLNKSGVTPYYLGWDHTGNAGTSGVGIHHPAGDVKKIATLTRTPTNNWNGNTNFWSLYWSQTANGYSVTEGGSSGSPLINNSRRVIGQLYGGSHINCSNPSQDIGAYGKFNISWTGNNNTDRRRRLRDWLDPSGISTGTLDGLAKECTGTTYIQNITMSTSRSYSGCNIQIINSSVINNATVLVNAEKSIVIKPGFAAIQGTTFIAKAGTSTLGLRSVEGESDATYLSTDEVADNSVSLSPNPTNGMLTFNCGDYDAECSINIYSATGKLVYSNNNAYNGETIDLTSQATGMYLARITVNGKVFTEKIIVK